MKKNYSDLSNYTKIKSASAGFTLMELLIVVAIIGALGAMAIPAYLDNVKKTRRADAQGVLLQFANAMERHYTEQTPFTYEGAASGGSDTGTPDSSVFVSQSPKSGTAFYNLTINASSANAYTLRATPTGGQSSDECGYLTLTNTGVKGVEKSTVANCW